MGTTAAQEPLARATTNTRKGSTVTVQLDPEPLAFYRPETNELLVVPAEQSTAFLNEVRFLDRLMYDSVNAKQACLDASRELLEAQRAAAGPDSNVPPDPRVLLQAQARMDAANRTLEQKQKKLEDAFKPLGTLDGTGGKLYELVPIVKRKTPLADAGTPVQRDHHAWAKKWTYVRSDKVKSHFRSYPLKSSEQSEYQSNQKKTVLDEQGRIDWPKLRKQINELKTSIKWKKEVEAHGVFFKDLNQAIHDSLENWAQGVGGKAGPFEVKLEPEAQLLRYFAGAGVGATWAPKKGNIAVRANVAAEFAIAEGKFKATAYWPGQAGFMLEMTGPVTKKLYKAGMVRTALELELYGLAGASASAQLGVEVDYSDMVKRRVGMRGKPRAKAISNKPVDIAKEVRDGAQAGGAVDVFAGARAAGSIKGQFEWNNPEARAFTALCEIGPGGQLQVGAGASAAFRITFADGKFRFLLAASACLGVGAGGKLEFEVDAEKTYEFSKYVAYMLYSVGYEYTGLFTKGTYELLTDFGVWAIAEGKDIEAAVNYFVKNYEAGVGAVSAFAAGIVGNFEIEAVRTKLMETVLSDPGKLDYATPEAKGMILYQLTRHDFHSVAGVASIPANTDPSDVLPWRLEFIGKRKRAIMTVCKKVRSKAEFRNVMQHMRPDGKKDKNSDAWQVNFATVKAVLDLGADSQNMDQKLTDYYYELPGQTRQPVDSGQALQALYERLYDKPVLGYAFVDNTSETYLARLDMGDHAGFAIAGGYNPGPEYPGSEDGPTRYA